ncbi:serine/threonine protein kinase, partial [Streptosporangium sp. NPDC049248]
TPELVALLTACLDKHPYERPDTKAAMLRLLGQESAALTPDEGDRTADSGPERNSPDGAVPAAVADAPARPRWGPPVLPGSTPPAGAVAPPDAAPIRERQKAGGFPLILAACVGVVALLSGLGLWAVESYTSLGPMGRTAAGGEVSNVLSASPGQGRGLPPGDGQGGEDMSAGKVTVPWGTTTEPQVPDVRPLRLNIEDPAATSPAPAPTSPVTPPSIPLPALPATTAPAAPRKADPKAPPTARPKKTSGNTRAAKPTAEPTAKPAPRPTTTTRKASPTQKPSQTPTSTKPSQEPTSAKPSQEPTKPSQAPTSTKPSQPAKAAQTTAPAPKSTPPASRPNPYTPQQVCGSGYYVQRSDSFSGGTTYQLYNASAGSNCVVTMKSANVGTATSIWATLEVQGGGSRTDRGNYEYYAGPVILSAKGKCVRFSGGGPGGSTGADWANCG